MEYDIKKDAKPEDTVARIKKILNEIGIETEVFCTGCGENYYSVRVNFRGTDIGTNGKGTCEINALASGYAEFMERLQSQYTIKLKNNFYIKDSDEKIVSNIENVGIIGRYIINNLKINPKTIEKIIKLSSSLIKKDMKDAIPTIPFVSYKERKIKFIDSFLIEFMQHSNGLAAGNTYEEACVQALSEIIERYCQKEIFLKKICMPEIPEKCYKQYKKIIDLIKEIENFGYKITIKDASLGKNLPTICCVFEDLKYPKNGVCVKFGAHPYFNIALKRTLTEFIQGGIVQKREFFHFNTKTNNLKLRNAIYSNCMKTSFYKKNNKYLRNFLSLKSDYLFNKNTWLFDENYNNKKLFDNIIKIILKISNDVYIRNLSFLGFPVVKIFVPNMSTAFLVDVIFFENYKNILEWEYFVKEKEMPEHYTLQNLVSMCKYIIQMQTEAFEEIVNLGQMSAKYLGFYCAITLNNKKEIKRFLRRILNQQLIEGGANKQNDTLRLYQTLGLFYKLNWKKYTKEQIKEKIEKQYGHKYYKRISNILSIVNEKTILDSLHEKENVSETKNYKKLQIKLGEIYKNNPPNQNEILKIIDSPNIFNKIYNKLCPSK